MITDLPTKRILALSQWQTVEFLPTRTQQKSTGINIEQNYVTVTLCIRCLELVVLSFWKIVEKFSVQIYFQTGNCLNIRTSWSYFKGYLQSLRKESGDCCVSLFMPHLAVVDRLWQFLSGVLEVCTLWSLSSCLMLCCSVWVCCCFCWFVVITLQHFVDFVCACVCFCWLHIWCCTLFVISAGSDD